MQPEGMVERGLQRRWQHAAPPADPLDGDGPDLLGLGLGVAMQAGEVAGNSTWNG